MFHILPPLQDYYVYVYGRLTWDPAFNCNHILWHTHLALWRVECQDMLDQLGNGDHLLPIHHPGIDEWGSMDEARISNIYLHSKSSPFITPIHPRQLRYGVYLKSHFWPGDFWPESSRSTFAQHDFDQYDPWPQTLPAKTVKRGNGDVDLWPMTLGWLTSMFWPNFMNSTETVPNISIFFLVTFHVLGIFSSNLHRQTDRHTYIGGFMHHAPFCSPEPSF